jgi:hypothetical protein
VLAVFPAVRVKFPGTGWDACFDAVFVELSAKPTGDLNGRNPQRRLDL